MDATIMSAALYFKPRRPTALSSAIFDALEGMLVGSGLPVNYYEAEINGKGRQGDDYPDQKPQLLHAFQSGGITSLGLYSTLSHYKQLAFGWRGLVWFHQGSGLFFVGLEDKNVSYPGIVLRNAFEIAKGGFDVDYGVGFSRQLLKGPLFYALGWGTTAVSEESEELERWASEMQGRRRYLKGRYRGAYPASILSQKHLRNQPAVPAKTGICGCGKCSALDDAHVLWELQEAEIPLAQEALAKADVLI